MFVCTGQALDQQWQLAVVSQSMQMAVLSAMFRNQ